MARKVAKAVTDVLLAQNLEKWLEVIVIVALGIYIVAYASVFEISYPKSVVHLYVYPWWRLLIVSTLILAGRWSPTVGVFLAVMVFFYFNDMDTLTSPFSVQK